MLSRLSRPGRSFQFRRTTIIRRAGILAQRLENRLLFSIPEPNDTFAQAYTPSDNIYLEQNLVVTDSVAAGSDNDDFLKFYNLFGTSHLYAPLDGLSANADLYVYDQNQNLLASSTLSGNQSETVNVDLPGNQYFYVRVHAVSGTANYSLYLYNDYAGSTRATARDIGTSWGQGSDKYWNYDRLASEDYLDYRDNVDYVKFSMEAPGTISLRMKDFTYTGNLIADMQLQDSNGGVLADTSGTVGDGLNVDRYSLNTGTYYVKYTQTSGSDPYTLRIVSDYAGDVTGTARNLGDLTNSAREEYDMVGGPFGLPTYEDATDLYKFTVSKTVPLYLDLQIAQGLIAPTFDASLQLAKDTNNDGFIQPNEIITQSANAGDDTINTTLNAGTYYAVVIQNGAYTSYQLDFDSDADKGAAYNDMSKARSFGTLIGETFADDGFGVFPGGDATDFFKFQLSAPGTIQASVYNNIFYSHSTTTPSLAIIKDSNNNQKFDTGENVTPFSSTGALASGTLAAGTYYLEVAGGGGESAYSLRMVPDYAPGTLSTARKLATITGLAPATQTFKDYIEQDFGAGSDVNDVYTFTLPLSYAVTLKTTGVSGEDLVLQLIKDSNNNGNIDSGDIIAASDNPNSPNETITKTLDTGKYFLRVHGVNGSTNYTLSTAFAYTDNDNTITKVNGRSGNIKSLGQSVDFTMNPNTDVDLVRFAVVAGQHASFDVDSRNSSNLDTYLRLFKSDGTQLAANNDGAAPGESASKFSYLEYTFPTSGNYYIGVSLNPNKSYSATTGSGGVAGGTTGDYRLYLNNLGTTSPTILRVDAGGNSFVAANGNYFLADTGFTGGTKSTTSFAVANTADDYLYYTNRTGKNFSFSKAIANGKYKLQLNFADSGSSAKSQRTFNVLAEGTKILSNFDVFAAASAAKTAVSKSFDVTVADGKIDLSFAGVLGNALISSISLVKE